jgi:hypothetical protein
MAETAQSPQRAVRAGFTVVGELLGTKSQEQTKQDGTKFVRYSAQLLVGESVVYVNFFDQREMELHVGGAPDRALVQIPCRLRAYVKRDGTAAMSVDALRPQAANGASAAA